MQENEEENVKVKLQNPHQAVSVSILGRMSDSLVYKEKECCKIMTKKTILVWQSRAGVDSLGNFFFTVL